MKFFKDDAELDQFYANRGVKKTYMPYLEGFLHLWEHGVQLHYSCERGGWISTHFDILDDKFQVHVNGTSDYIYFDNFHDMLMYWMKGNFYQGESFRQTPTYLIPKSDGSVLVYQNPYYK